ncbi:MAG: hypothetical protein GF331_15460 [Chitinivibrionales bacterium]|nr:hypothetical protein [Chitinivibrionales bacterium]
MAALGALEYLREHDIDVPKRLSLVGFDDMLIHLKHDRGSAIVYLDDMAKRHTGKAEQHLSAAAAVYRRIMDLLQARPMPSMASEKVLEDYATMVQRVSELEHKAVAALREAVDAMSGA